MSAAPTAASVLRDLDRRAQQRHLDMLGDLDAREHDAVRAALARVKGAARIDVRVLLDDVRRGIREAHTFESPAERDAFRQHIADSLAEWRAECERRGLTGSDSATSARRYGVMLQMQSEAAPTQTTTAAVDDVEPDDIDDDLDDDDLDQPAPRKPVARVRLRRRTRGAQDADPPPAAPQAPATGRIAATGREKRPTLHLFGRLLGPGADDRPYGQSVDYDTRAETFKPPWLLSDDGDEDDEPDPEPEKKETADR